MAFAEEQETASSAIQDGATSSSSEVDVGPGVETLMATRVGPGQKRERRPELVVQESPLTIFLNGEELVTLMCTPVDLEYLAAGFLYSEGLVQSRDDLKKLVVDKAKGRVWAETPSSKKSIQDLMFKRLVPSGCGRGALFYHPVDSFQKERVESHATVEAAAILSLAARFQTRSRLFRMTGGVHAAALCDTSSILLFSEDIARHNAIDRLFGRCLLDGTETGDKLIFTSGRISSEMLLKVARRGMPFIVSKSAPTALALHMAEELNITVVGYARGRRMNVYTHEWRVTG